MSDRIDRIERYLSGRMPDTERRTFEADLEQDPVLRSEVDRMRIIDEALDLAVENDLRQQLAILSDATAKFNNKKPSRRLISVRWAAAASVLLLISAGVWYVIGKGSSALGHFQNANYVAYDYSQIRGDLSSRSDFPLPASDKDFDKAQAVDWFKAWLDAHPDDYEVRYMLADILKDLQRNDEAREQLSILIGQQSIIWGEKAEWNYVLLSVPDQWDVLSRELFRKMLADPSHSYHPQALELSAIITSDSE